MRNNYRNNRINRTNQFIITNDYGNDPFVVNIEKATEQNNNFRTTLWTGTYMQTTLMSIEPGSSIGLEIHPDTDQFLKIESGMGQVFMGKARENLNFRQNIREGFAIFVPAGTWHNVVNTGKSPLKLYSVYAPPHHPRGTVNATKSAAESSP